MNLSHYYHLDISSCVVNISSTMTWYTCKECGKSFKHCSSLCRHKKICEKTADISSNDENPNTVRSPPHDITIARKRSISTAVSDDDDDDVTSSNSIKQSSQISPAKKRKNRHKMVKCLVCSKSMRSDHIKRHQRVHKNAVHEYVSAMDDKLNPDDRRNIQILRSRLNIGVTSQSAGDYVSGDKEMTAQDIELKNSMLLDNQLYWDNVELGRRVSVIVAENEINEESLTIERKDALYIYISKTSAVVICFRL